MTPIRQPTAYERVCPACQGDGYGDRDACVRCGGTGLVKRRQQNPTDLWARELRLNERENVVSAFLMVMERREIAEASEIVADVEAFFAKIEGAVERGS